MRRNEFWRIILTLVVCWTSASTAATPGRERGATSQVRIEGFDPLIPTLRKWYVPQDLYYIYDWGGYKYTNYAKDHFARYVSTELEGRGRYDIFGNWGHPRLGTLPLARGTPPGLRQFAIQRQQIRFLVPKLGGRGRFQGSVLHCPHHRRRNPHYLDAPYLQSLELQWHAVGLHVRQVPGYSAPVPRQ